VLCEKGQGKAAAEKKKTPMQLKQAIEENMAATFYGCGNGRKLSE
jgi:hypothetical protein